MKSLCQSGLKSSWKLYGISRNRVKLWDFTDFEGAESYSISKGAVKVRYDKIT